MIFRKFIKILEFLNHFKTLGKKYNKTRTESYKKPTNTSIEKKFKNTIKADIFFRSIFNPVKEIIILEKKASVEKTILFKHPTETHHVPLIPMCDFMYLSLYLKNNHIKKVKIRNEL